MLVWNCKKLIFKKLKKLIKTADFICTLHSYLKGSYREHMIGHGFSVGSRCSKEKSKKKAMELTEEQWAKRPATHKKS